MSIVWDIEYFWQVCPYTIADLQKKDRKQKYLYWRQVGMYVGKKSGMSHREAAGIFNQHHATCVHAVKCVENAIDGYSPDLYEVLSEYVMFAPTFEDVIPSRVNHDVCVNEMICLTIMDGIKPSRMNF